MKGELPMEIADKADNYYIDFYWIFFFAGFGYYNS